MRVTDGTKVTDGRKDERTDGRTGGRTDGMTNGRKDGAYSAGVKDSASAYVLCPRLMEQLCLSIWKGIGSAERNLEGFRDGNWKECGKTERWDLT